MKTVFFVRRRTGWPLFLGVLLIELLAMLASIQVRFSLPAWLLVISKVGDASEYLSVSRSVSLIPILGTHMPLYPMLIAFGSLIVVPVEAALAVSVLSFIGFALVVYFLTRRMWVGLFASCFPYFLFKYSMYVYADLPTVFFAAMAFYFLTKDRLPFGILFGGCAVATHYLALLLIPAFIYAMYRKRARYAILGLIPSVPFVAMSILKFLYIGNLLYYFQDVFQVWARSGGGKSGFLAFPFASALYVAANLNALISPWALVNVLYALIIFAPVYVLQGLGAYLAFRGKAYLELMWGLPLLLLITVLSPAGFFYVPRYSILAFPFILRSAKFANDVKAYKTLLALIAIGNVIYSFGSILLFPQAGTG